MIPLTQGSPLQGPPERFSKNLRFSDPVSGAALADAEADLASCVDELHRAVSKGNQHSAVYCSRKQKCF